MKNENIYYTIDRITEGIAVCFDDEDNKMELPLGELYENAKESDVFIKKEKHYFFDSDETEKRKQSNLNLFKKITRKGYTD